MSNSQLKESRTTTQRNGARAVIIGGALLLIVLLIAGILPRLKRQSELAANAREQQDAAPLVTTAKPKAAPPTNELTLPAITQAIQETIIYARHGGYVKKWYAGLGQSVKAGQLLCEIEAPEADQQLSGARQGALEAEQNITQARSELSAAEAALEQAQATLKQAQTNLALARTNLERSKQLVAQGIVPQQDTDDKQAEFDARQADLEAAQANIRARQAAIKAQQSAIGSRQAAFSARKAEVQRLVEIHGFQKVVAPFDGVITARNIEVGVLINASGATSAGLGLYRIAKLDTIRIFISVPQTYVASVQQGMPVEVLVREFRDKVYKATVFGTAHTVDPATKTMMVEVRVPNPEKQLYSGMGVGVKFSLATPGHAFIVPAAALVTNADGTQLLTVSSAQSIHVQKVIVGRDLGKDIEILDGLQGDETIVSNPSDSLHEGTRVQIPKK